MCPRHWTNTLTQELCCAAMSGHSVVLLHRYYNVDIARYHNMKRHDISISCMAYDMNTNALTASSNSKVVICDCFSSNGYH